MIRTLGRIAFTVALVLDGIPRAFSRATTSIDTELAQTSLVGLALKIIIDEDAAGNACRCRTPTYQSKGKYAP